MPDSMRLKDQPASERPRERAAIIARLHEVGQVGDRRYTGKTARLKARIPPHFHHEFPKFIVE